MNELVKLENEQLAGLEPSKAAQVKAVFEPMVEMLESFEGKYSEVMSFEEIGPEVCAEAKALRLEIRKVRTGADKIRKDLKDEYLRAGNAIQGVYNILKWAVEEKEKNLEEVETFYERIEAEKKMRLQSEREAELLKYDSDGSQIDLGGMHKDVWSNYLTGAKANYEKVKAAEKKAAADAAKEQKRKDEYDARIKEILPYSEYIDTGLVVLGMKVQDYQKLLGEAKQNKVNAEAEREELRKKSEAIEKKAREDAAEADRKLQAEREERARLDSIRRARLGRLPGIIIIGDHLHEPHESEVVLTFEELGTLPEEDFKKVEEAYNELYIENANKKAREAAQAAAREAREREEKEEAERRAAASDKEKLFELARVVGAEHDGMKGPGAQKIIKDVVKILIEYAETL